MRRQRTWWRCSPSSRSASRRSDRREWQLGRAPCRLWLVWMVSELPTQRRFRGRGCERHAIALTTLDEQLAGAKQAIALSICRPIQNSWGISTGFPGQKHIFTLYTTEWGCFRTAMHPSDSMLQGAYDSSIYAINHHGGFPPLYTCSPAMKILRNAPLSFLVDL